MSSSTPVVSTRTLTMPSSRSQHSACTESQFGSSSGMASAAGLQCDSTATTAASFSGGQCGQSLSATAAIAQGCNTRPAHIAANRPSNLVLARLECGWVYRSNTVSWSCSVPCWKKSLSIIHSQHCSGLASSIVSSFPGSVAKAIQDLGWNLCVILEGVRKVQVKPLIY